jgi:membrane associated rhomboid family serine protease
MDQRRERAINVPLAVLLLIAVLLAAYAWEAYRGVDTVVTAWGFAPRQLVEGRYITLVSSLFVHGSWPHVLANAAFALAFATPVARRLGEDLLGAAAFLMLYLACGVLAGLGYALTDLQSANFVVGASGAVAGMMGAASRLIGQPPGAIAPFNSPGVIGMAVSWIGINVLFGLVLVGWAPGSGGAPIAWQDHLAGYAAGLLLFSPLLSLMRRRQGDHVMEN